METVAGLIDPDPAVRKDTLGRVRYRDLKEPAVLAAVLAACRDLCPVPGAAAVDDPFAAFFSGREAATLADVAAERLAKTGLPPDLRSVATIRAALEAPGPIGRLATVVARAIGETAWEDLGETLRALIPALDPHDEPLFQAIVQLPSAATPVLAELAARPLRLRLLQELLNHPLSRPAVVDAIERAFEAEPPTEDQASAVLAVLAAWADPAVARIASRLAPRFPWVVVWQALEDPAAPLEAWLAENRRPELLARVSEVLRQRGLPEGFPLAAWLRAAEAEHGLCRAFGVDREGVVEVLDGWVAALERREGPPDRGWTAASALIRAGRPVSLGNALGYRDPDWMAPWDAGLLADLAALPGADALVLDGLREAPDQVAIAVPALLTLGVGAARAGAEVVLGLAEQAEITVEPVARGTVRERRQGVDVEAIRPLVERVGDPVLTARFEAMLPVVRAG